MENNEVNNEEKNENNKAAYLSITFLVALLVIGGFTTYTKYNKKAYKPNNYYENNNKSKNQNKNNIETNNNVKEPEYIVPGNSKEQPYNNQQENNNENTIQTDNDDGTNNAYTEDEYYNKDDDISKELVIINDRNYTSNYFHIEKGNIYDIYKDYSINYDTSKYGKVFTNSKVTYDYPVFDIDTPSIKEFNAFIKKQWDTTEKEMSINEGVISDSGCICIKKDNKFYCQQTLIFPEYSIYEEKERIIVRISNGMQTYCSGTAFWGNFYTISLAEQKVLNQDEIINSFGYNRNEIIDELDKYVIEQAKVENSDYTESDIKDINDTAEFFIYNNQLTIGYQYYDSIKFVQYINNTFTDITKEAFEKIIQEKYW